VKFSGIELTPSLTLYWMNGPYARETPISSDGAVVLALRCSVREEREEMFSLNPEPTLPTELLR